MPATMVVNAIDSLSSLEGKENISEIVGLSKIDGNIHDTRAKRDTELSKFHEKIFEDQLLANTRLLQYYNKLNCQDKLACSLQRSALQVLSSIYYLKLRPGKVPEAPIIEKVLQKELLIIISRTYGIQSKSGCPSKIEGRGSPLWDLNDLSIKLIRVFIDSSLLSTDMAKDVESCLIDVIINIHQHQMKGQILPINSSNFALLAHCLWKLFQVNNSSPESGPRRPLSLSFICDHLFPLACEFAAKEYPATIVDPVGHYELFEKIGDLSEPDEALAEWNRRNERKSTPKNSGGTADNCGDPGGDPLPSAHACLEYLIYRLALSSTEVDQGIIVNFLQGKIYRLGADNYGQDIYGSSTGVDGEARKLAVMNKVVALHVLGRVMLHLKSEAISTFMRTKALPYLPQDSLLLKICKFQMLRYWCTDETEDRSKLAHIFLKEFMSIEGIADFQDERNRLFVIFTCVGADILYVGDIPCFNDLTDSYFKPLSWTRQLSLVKKLITLYLDCKIITPLVLIDELSRINEADNSFKSECEQQWTTAINLIASQFLKLFFTNKKYDGPLLGRAALLYSATRSRTAQLPNETVEKLLKIVEIRLLDDPSLHRGYQLITWHVHTQSYLRCALRCPLSKRSQAQAMRIFDRLLNSFQASNYIEFAKMTFATMILASLCFYQVTNTLSSDSRDRNECNMRDLLFDSPNRIGSICATCDLINGMPDMTSCRILSILMSWPSWSVAFETKTPGASRGLKTIWQRLVELTLIGLREFELTKESYGFNSCRTFSGSLSDVDPNYRQKSKTRENFLYALIAAFNHEPKLLESWLIRFKGPSGNGDSHILRYVKLWLDSVMRPDGFLIPDFIDLTIANRSYVLISYQALVNIHRAHTNGELVFSIKGLTGQLNSARRTVLDWLSDLREQIIQHDSQLKEYYANSIRQLEAIGNFQ